MPNEDWKERTRLLFGDACLELLQRSHVLVAGVGGVGAYAAEMICRAGVGSMTIVDADTVAVSNINRQLPALFSTVGQSKAALMGARLRDINPELRLTALDTYLDEQNIPRLLDEVHFDFIVDAIDTISPKVTLIAEALRRKLKIVSSMGAGAKSDITKVRFANVWDTYNCGLSRAVRQALRKRGMEGWKLPVVFSSEPADMNAVKKVTGERNKLTTVGTVSYMPAVFGCYLAEYVIRHLAASGNIH